MRKPLAVLAIVTAFVLAVTVSALSQNQGRPPEANRCTGIAVENDEGTHVVYRAFEDGRVEFLRKGTQNAKWQPVK